MVECRYAHIDKEALAIVFGHFIHICMAGSSQFTPITGR